MGTRDTPASRTPSIDRRQVLQATGAAALGTVALSGPATAHPPAEIRFCGCSEVCVDTTKSYRIVYATDPDDPSGADSTGRISCRIWPPTDEPEPRRPDCFTAEDDEQIVGVIGGDRRVYHNPLSCAWPTVEQLDLAACEGCVDGNCTTRVEYELTGVNEFRVASRDDESAPERLEDLIVRVGRCSPPSTWDDGSTNPSDGTDSSTRSLATLLKRTLARNLL